MRIALTRIDNRTHRLAIERVDGTREAVECETRSLLIHDLVHFAVEAEARVDDGFYGLLARGVPLARLNDRDDPPPGDGLMAVERIVGPLQSIVNGRAPAEAVTAGGVQLGARAIDAAFVEAVQARMRHLVGRWRATPFHASMVLQWPPFD